MSDRKDLKKTESEGGSGSIDSFLSKVAVTPKQTSSKDGRGKILFALDATASRQPTWDKAATMQGRMFETASGLGGVDIQLAFYRGFGEFKVSRWTKNGTELARLMASVACMAGATQIGKVLGHAVNEAKQGQLNALIFVGDSCEEDIDTLGARAGELGLLGVPVFVFHEGDDPIAQFAFEQIAKLTGGACCRFDGASADMLGRLLGAVAAFAAGGRVALENLARDDGGAVGVLTNQMKRR